MTISYSQFNELEHHRDTFTPEQVDEYVAAAQAHYRDLPYHNWDHAGAVMDGVEAIADKLEKQNVFIARGALKIAAAWHDAGYHEDHSALGFNSKEQYSAALLGKYLQGKPVNDFVRHALLRRPILATQHKYTPRLPTDLILHRADIANIGGPTDEFMDANRKLWHENGHGSWDRHVALTRHFVEFCIVEHDYESLMKNLKVDDTTIDVNDENFGDAASRNIATLQSTADNLLY